MADLARFTVGLGIDPASYWQLTVAEHQALVAEANRRR